MRKQNKATNIIGITLPTTNPALVSNKRTGYSATGTQLTKVKAAEYLPNLFSIS